MHIKNYIWYLIFKHSQYGPNIFYYTHSHNKLNIDHLHPLHQWRDHVQPRRSTLHQNLHQPATYQPVHGREPEAGIHRSTGDQQQHRNNQRGSYHDRQPGWKRHQEFEHRGRPEQRGENLCLVQSHANFYFTGLHQLRK